MAPTTVTAYNSGQHTIEVAGVFWPGRSESSNEVDEKAVHKIEEHPQLEIRSEVPGLAALNKDDLVAMAKEKGVSHSGNKEEIIARIQEHEEEGNSGEEEE